MKRLSCTFSAFVVSILAGVSHQGSVPTVVKHDDGSLRFSASNGILFQGVDFQAQLNLAKDQLNEIEDRISFIADSANTQPILNLGSSSWTASRDGCPSVWQQHSTNAICTGGDDVGGGKRPQCTNAHIIKRFQYYENVTQLRARVTSYQIGSPDGFNSKFSANPDGIVLELDDEPIWMWAIGISNKYKEKRFMCPNSNGESKPPTKYQDMYFCESGADFDHYRGFEKVVFNETVLFQDKEAVLEFPQRLQGELTLKLCHDEDTNNEDISIRDYAFEWQ